MLNTDAHSKMILPKNKMTKQQFIKNNMIVCKLVPREFFDTMFDRITKNKFECKTDCRREVIFGQL